MRSCHAPLVENRATQPRPLSRMARMPNAVSVITERVRERVRAERLDLGADPTAAERLVRDELRAYAERSLAGSLPTLGDEQAALGRVLADLTGYGPLQPYFNDPEVEEIWINAPDSAYVIPTTKILRSEPRYN